MKTAKFFAIAFLVLFPIVQGYYLMGISPVEMGERIINYIINFNILGLIKDIILANQVFITDLYMSIFGGVIENILKSISNILGFITEKATNWWSDIWDTIIFWN